LALQEHTILKATPLSPVANLPYPKDEYSPYPMPWKLRRNPKENHWGVQRLQAQSKSLYKGLAQVSEELEQVVKQLKHSRDVVMPHVNRTLLWRYSSLVGNPANKEFPDFLQRCIKDQCVSIEKSVHQYEDQQMNLVKCQIRLEGMIKVVEQEISDKESALAAEPREEYATNQVPPAPPLELYGDSPWNFWVGPGENRKSRTKKGHILMRNDEEGLQLKEGPWRFCFNTSTPRCRPAMRWEGPYKGVNGAILRKTLANPDDTTHRHDALLEVISDAEIVAKIAFSAVTKSRNSRSGCHVDDSLVLKVITDRCPKLAHTKRVMRDRLEKELKTSQRNLSIGERELEECQSKVPQEYSKAEEMAVRDLKFAVHVKLDEVKRFREVVAHKEEVCRGIGVVCKVEAECAEKQKSVSLLAHGVSVGRPEREGRDESHRAHLSLPKLDTPTRALSSTM